MKLLRLLRPEFKRYRVYVLDRQQTATAPAAKADLRVERVAANNVNDICGFRGDSVATTFRRFLDEKNIGVYAYSAGAAVGHAWAAVWHGADRLIWGYLPVNAQTACIYYCSVSVECRGRKFYQNMLAALAGIVFRETSACRILIATATDNPSSYSAIERVGFRLLLVLPVLHWWGRAIRLARIPPAPPAEPGDVPGRP